MRKFLSGMVVVSVLKLIFYAISTAIKLIANIMVFFGLYVPFFYLIFGEMLLLFAGFSLTPYNTNVGLFIFGLVLSCFCSVIITVKNLILKPIKAVFGRDSDKEIRYPIRRRPIRYTGGRYPAPRRTLPPPIRSREYGYLRIDSPKEYFDRLDYYYERPDVYRSELNQDIIVYEYRDRFDLYRHNGEFLEYVDTEYR
ncbi:MAG: hypothetical protein ACOX3U_07865 [Christensenellales bacterium]|jgi:hypothetical protein